MLQQAAFTRHGQGFDVKRGKLALMNCHYRDKRGNHLKLGSGGSAEVAACNFPTALMVNGKPVAAGARVPRLVLRHNAHRGR